MTGIRPGEAYFHMKFQSAISCHLNILMEEPASRTPPPAPRAMQRSLHSVSSKSAVQQKVALSHFFPFWHLLTSKMCAN